MRKFTPGSLISMITPKQFYCNCSKQQLKRFNGQRIFPNVSQNMIISQIIKTSLGGTTSFGNGYLGQDIYVDALGSIEGQIGGSFYPIRNKF
jgi:hypothetical protein